MRGEKGRQQFHTEHSRSFVVKGRRELGEVAGKRIQGQKFSKRQIILRLVLFVNYINLVMKIGRREVMG